MSDSKQAKFDEALEDLVQELVKEELKYSIEDDGFILLRADRKNVDVVFVGPEKEAKENGVGTSYEYSIDLAELMIREAEATSEEGRLFLMSYINSIAERINAIKD